MTTDSRVIPPTDENIARAARVLRGGGLVAFPTETVYGLGADAFNEAALALVFEAKRRPRFDPLIIHIARLETLNRLVDFSAMTVAARERLDALTKRFWPGPLTFVAPKLPVVPDLATAGLPSLAVRFPSNEIAQKLIESAGGAVAAPSANPFGYVSPTSAAHAAEMLGGAVSVILDGGGCEIGVESTVLDLNAEPPAVLRYGGVNFEDLQTLFPEIRHREDGAANGAGKGLPSPGILARHYSPKTPLFLHSHGEMAALPKEPYTGYLYMEDDLRKAAAALFSKLRAFDAAGYKAIHAELAPEEGLGRAINDRLRRGASAL